MSKFVILVSFFAIFVISGANAQTFDYSPTEIAIVKDSKIMHGKKSFTAEVEGNPKMDTVLAKLLDEKHKFYIVEDSISVYMYRGAGYYINLARPNKVKAKEKTASFVEVFHYIDGKLHKTRVYIGEKVNEKFGKYYHIIFFKDSFIIYQDGKQHSMQMKLQKTVVSKIELD